jgi:hypothetical protein
VASGYEVRCSVIVLRQHAVPVLGRERSREPGLEPRFVPPGQLAGIDLHPALAGHLYRLLDPGPHGQVPFVGNFWRQA